MSSPKVYGENELMEAHSNIRTFIEALCSVIERLNGIRSQNTDESIENISVFGCGKEDVLPHNTSAPPNQHKGPEVSSLYRLLSSWIPVKEILDNEELVRRLKIFIMKLYKDRRIVLPDINAVPDEDKYVFNFWFGKCVDLLKVFIEETEASYERFLEQFV